MFTSGRRTLEWDPMPGRSLLVLLAVALTVSAQPSATSSRVDRPVRVGLALSGGAALGFAHIGVLKVLEREGIPVSCISGNSMGSMVGGVYSAGYTAAEIESVALDADWERLFSSGVPFGARYLPERQQSERYAFQLRHKNFFPSLPSGIIPLQNVEFLLMELLSEVEYNTGFDFDSLPIPYRAVAVDLVTGRKEVFERGRLAQAIRASIAIPGVFAPERLDEMELVDGGVQQYLPVDPLLEFEPDFIIAVLTMKHNAETGISLIDVASRSMDVINPEDLARQKALADVLIEPDVDPFAHSDFARAEGLIEAGERAAEAALPEIRRKLSGRLPVGHRRPVSARPLSMVRAVVFEGLRTTRESVLAPLMETRPGRYLLFPRLRQDLERVFHTGLFEDVNYRLVPAPGESVDVVVELIERAYGFYWLGLRYDNADDVVLGVEVGQGNLGGSGASVRAAINLGDPNEVRLGITGTRLFMFPFGYRVDGYWSSVDRSFVRNGRWQADYSSDYRGGVAEAGYIIGRDAFFDFGVKAYQARHRMPALTAFDTLPVEELLFGPTFRFAYNSFNDLHIPTTGLRYGLHALYGHVREYDADGAGLGDHDFLKLEVVGERVVPLGRRSLLRPGVELGGTFGRASWAEQFRTGPGRMPGFVHEEFTSPQKAIARLGFDLLVGHLFGQENYPFYVGMFGTAGSFRRLDELVDELVPARDLEWSAGVGLLTNTPVGPFRLLVGVADFGKPAPDAGARVNVTLSVGREFRYSP